ncbi:GGDEF domain-containing protein [uncultured Meiothermus sp.]|uniref:GGDEF domain-containing protein n=1 Tax=uncultured Meiothermus sp. TaxID=157471 RepID=UPI002613AEEA|nr:GGDEF domain-containing protein [uncultured Meiothermus sp.]
MFRWLSDHERQESRMRGYYIPLLALGAVASLIGRLMSTGQTWVDFAFLPAMTVSFSLLAILLSLRRISITTVKLSLLGIICVYQLVSLSDYALAGRLYTDGLSATALWFPVVFPVAFVFLPAWAALRFSVLFYVLAVLIGLLGLSITAEVEQRALNTVIQFYLACLAFLYTQAIYARYREQYVDMHQMAHTDPLTGIANRRLMQDLLEKSCEAARADKAGFAVLLIDLDHFKRINDLYGHSVGDQVLREVASLLQGVLRQDQTLARWGGEEFMVLAPKTSMLQAQEIARDIAESLARTKVVGQFEVSASIGLAAYRDGDSSDAVVRRADAAMYRAKASGRNRVEVEA